MTYIVGIAALVIVAIAIVAAMVIQKKSKTRRRSMEPEQPSVVDAIRIAGTGPVTDHQDSGLRNRRVDLVP